VPVFPEGGGSHSSAKIQQNEEQKNAIEKWDNVRTGIIHDIGEKRELVKG